MKRYPFIFSAAILVGSCSTLTMDSGVPKQFQNLVLEESFEPYPGIVVHRYEDMMSGLNVLISPRPGSGVVAFTTTYDVGARLEQPGRTGLAHLFEHMMFRGTPSFPEPFKTLGEWGGHYNAFTSQDITHYYEIVPRELFSEAAKFESERMRKLQLTSDVFATERGAVVSERKMRTEDSPMGRLYWEIYQTAFDDHPYKNGVIGWQEDLDQMKHEDATDFYQRFYAPNRAVISIAGDFSVKEALNVINQHYGEFRRSNFEEPKIAKERTIRPDRRRIVKMKTESVILAESVFSESMNSPSIPAQVLMCHLILDDNLGLLQEELIQKGLARGVSGDCSGAADPDLSGFIVTGNPGVPLAKLEKAFDQALEKFPTWVNSERIQFLKLYYRKGLLQSLRDPLEMAKDFGINQILTKDPVRSFKMIDQIEGLKLDDVLASWRIWEHRSKTRVIIQPSEKTDPFLRVIGGKVVPAPKVVSKKAKTSKKEIQQ